MSVDEILVMKLVPSFFESFLKHVMLHREKEKERKKKRSYTTRNYIWEKRLIPLPRHIVHPPIYTLRVSIRRPRNPFKTKEGTCRKNDGCNQLETRDVSALMRFTRPRMRRADSYTKGRCNVVVHPPQYTATYPWGAGNPPREMGSAKVKIREINRS